MTNRPSRPNRTTGQSTGSEGTTNSEPEFLLVGEITRPHGIRGELLMQVATSYPERLAEISTLYFKARRSQEYVAQSIVRVRNHNKGLLLFIDGVESREQADDYRGQEVYIHLKDAVPLEDGEYYLFQIDGIRVVTDEGVELGRLTNVMETGANDVYIVSPDEGKDILLPAIPEVILRVDVEAGVMTVHVLDGLID